MCQILTIKTSHSVAYFVMCSNTGTYSKTCSKRRNLYKKQLFITAHAFCPSLDSPRNLGFVNDILGGSRQKLCTSCPGVMLCHKLVKAYSIIYTWLPHGTKTTSWNDLQLTSEHQNLWVLKSLVYQELTGSNIAGRQEQLTVI